jgi:hypothetical protein
VRRVGRQERFAVGPPFVGDPLTHLHARSPGKPRPTAVPRPLKREGCLVRTWCLARRPLRLE